MSKGADAIVLIGGLGVVGWALWQYQQGQAASAQPAVQYVNVPAARDQEDPFKRALIGGAIDLIGQVDFDRVGESVGGIFSGNRGTTTNRSGGFWDSLFGRTNRTAGFDQAGRPVLVEQPSTGGGIGSRLVNDLMRDYGLTRNQAAGVAGNLDHESGGFNTLQEINPLVPGSRGGYGYAQWTGPRRREFESWTSARGLDPTSYAANYGFLRYELDNTSEGRVVDRLRRTNTVEDATVTFQDTFLRPGIPHTASRVRRAQQYA